MQSASLPAAQPSPLGTAANACNAPSIPHLRVGLWGSTPATGRHCSCTPLASLPKASSPLPPPPPLTPLPAPSQPIALCPSSHPLRDPSRSLSPLLPTKAVLSLLPWLTPPGPNMLLLPPVVAVVEAAVAVAAAEAGVAGAHHVTSSYSG